MIKITVLTKILPHCYFPATGLHVQIQSWLGPGTGERLLCTHSKGCEWSSRFTATCTTVYSQFPYSCSRDVWCCWWVSWCFIARQFLTFQDTKMLDIKNINLSCSSDSFINLLAPVFQCWVYLSHNVMLKIPNIRYRWQPLVEFWM